VACEARDFLDREPESDMRLTKVCRDSRGRPLAVDVGGLDGGGELAADVDGVELAANAGDEYRPDCALLAQLQVGECVGGEVWEAKGAPWGSGVAVSAD
jgi:hypothetical protein